MQFPPFSPLETTKKSNATMWRRKLSKMLWWPPLSLSSSVPPPCALCSYSSECVCGVHPSAMSSKFIAERENWIECPLMWLYRWVLSSFLPPTLKYYSHPLPQLFRFRLYAWKFIDRHKCYFFNDYLTKYFELSYLLKKAKKPLLPPPSLLIFIAVLLFFLTIEHC